MYRSLLGMKEIRMSKVEVLQYHINTTVKKKVAILVCIGTTRQKPQVLCVRYLVV